MLVGAFVAVVILTWILVAMNVRAAVRQYDRDRNHIRLYSYLVTLLVLGSLIIGVASAVVQKVIDSENYLQADANESMPGVHYYHRG